MAVDVVLIVNGRRYEGWKSVRVTRSIESLAGSFALEVSDRWGGQADPWPIMEEDECEVQIGGETVITGDIATRGISANATSRELRYTGKDRAGRLVKNSLLVSGATVSSKAGKTEDVDPTKHGAAAAKWTYTNIDLLAFCRAIAGPHGISVSMQPGLTLTKATKLVVSPGEKCFDAIRRVAEAAEVLVVSDGVGGIRITRTGTARATQLTEGENILEAAVEYSAEERYRHYLISTQVPGTDQASGSATNVEAQATDDDVRRASDVLLIRPDKGYSTADARRRADWEARNRAANAAKVSITVQGWRQPNGTLWPLNALCRVRAPRLIGVDGDLLISQVEYSYASGGQITKMNLVRPDAFTPEPQARVSGQGAWLIGTGGGGFAEPAGTGGR